MAFLSNFFGKAVPSTTLVKASASASSYNNVNDSNKPLPPGWVKYMDSRTRHPYYVNSVQNRTQWEFPGLSSVAPANVSAPLPTPAQNPTAQTPPQPQSPPQSRCPEPSDLEDLYYYISPKNRQGPYIPQLTDDDINFAARKKYVEKYQRSPDAASFIEWTPGTIPQTSATGCMSQDLGDYFGVRVDGVNKVIIDAYNATFPNHPPPFPLKPKYFYYIRFINRDKEYQPRKLTAIDFALVPSEGLDRRLSIDSGWGKGNPQKIPNTNATGFMTSGRNGNLIYVRVDRENNAIIEAYNASLKNPAPAPSSTSTPAPAPAPLSTPAPAPALPAPQLEGVNPPASAQPSLSAKAPTPDPVSTPALPTSLPPTPISTPAPALSTPALPTALPVFLGPSQSTSSSTSTPAPVPAPSLPLAETLPSGWEVFREPSGRIYYGNPASKRVQYNWPTSGGAKNKKNTKRRSKRVRKASRRKASRRRTGKK